MVFLIPWQYSCPPLPTDRLPTMATFLCFGAGILVGAADVEGQNGDFYGATVLW